jgi:predicted RNA-binding Zn-ribbon protein involved in translation (DUF1610 family)
MEKKEARIKCSGCGASYKLRIPVTEKPVSFKCKKCGKVLKIRIAPAQPPSALATPPPPPAAPPQPETAPTIGDDLQFETTQLPDADYFNDQAPAAQSGFQEQLQGLETHSFSQAKEETLTPKTEGPVRRWIVLSGDMVKGPFSDDEIVSMIRDGVVDSETSLRMGERPWIKASEIAVFRQYFSRGAQPAGSPLESMTLLDTPIEKPNKSFVAPRPFYSGLGALAPYPLSRGGWKSLVVFLGIAFALCSVLSFDFLIGLPVSFAGWILLYGYLASLMHESGRGPGRPPSWNFSRIKNMVVEGIEILIILLGYCMFPVGALTLLMIAAFLNAMPALGYACIAAIVVVYAVTLFVVPAALVIFEKSRKLAPALNPGKFLQVVKRGGQPYRVLSLISIIAGLAMMLATIGAVFLVDIPDAGFLVAGFVMALVLSYGHFLWFHAIGRFSGENEKLTSQILAKKTV